MILKKLEITGFRGYYNSTEIEFDPEVTILTGANDSGKSSIIRLLTLIGQKGKIEEEDANLDILLDTNQVWSKNGTIRCTGFFEICDDSKNYVASQSVRAGYNVKIDFVLATGKSSVREILNEERVSVQIDNPATGNFPNVLLLPNHQTVGSIIDPQNMNSLEKRFVEAGFGQNAFMKVSALNPNAQLRQLEIAEDKLNTLLQPYMPKGIGVRLRLRFTSPETPETNKLVVSLRDNKGGMTALGLRGAGIQKLLTIFADLVVTDTVNQYSWVLFDEPENSLHADAQHLLRAILEEIGRNDKIQVIYATHSTAMINNVFPERIRLLERVSINEFATTKVVRNVTSDNFHPIRIQLGITPADSLLYTPVTIIVEGKTEAYNLGHIFARLGKDRYDDFPTMGTILSQSKIHFLDGGGDQFKKWIPMAQMQGVTPIILVDGDKIKVAEDAKKKYKIEYVSFDEGKEFEDIVPRSTYFQALISVTENQSLAESEFDKWLASSTTDKDKNITNQISKWLSSLPSPQLYDKEAVMKRALQLTPLEEIDLSKIEELLKKVSKALSLC